VCFVTGLLSHLIQNPPHWFHWPSRPAGMYRVTQGLHVATGVAAVPLLFAKLWSVYPRLFRGLHFDAAAIVERLSLVPLVAGSLFMLFTGVANIAQWYPWSFFFPRGHFWVAWITIGALVVHVSAQIGTARRALRRETSSPEVLSVQTGRVSRRAFLLSTGAASALLTLTTVGETWSPLRRFVLFAPRRTDIGPQELPVNRSASEARVAALATNPAYRLVVNGGGVARASLTIGDLQAMQQHRAALPIACVEGWSATAHWSGVRVRDVLARAGVARLHGRSVDVVSLEPGGRYNRSTLTAEEAEDHDTLLALQLNGRRLDLDHGYPLRLIAPNRPGVMQTKWVAQLVVS
jgi:DMSO/TMAO reductase YedYZ molybdopterin-dependent catalytic subunit